MIRPLRLTDIVAYLAFRNHAVLNEALLQPEDFPSTPTLRNGFLGRSFDIGRQSWVHIDRGQLDGLAAARPHLSGDVWDIDQLIVMPNADAGAVCQELLSHVVTAARDAGIQKVFLRVRSDSPVQLSARRAGFLEYAQEQVYRLPALGSGVSRQMSTFRPRRRSHHHAIFQLYCAAVPCQVREIEGMTLQEWRMAVGWGFRPTELHIGLIGLSPRRHDFVLERDGKVALWGYADKRARRLRLLAHPIEPREIVQAAIENGLAEFPTGSTISCPVRNYQPLVTNLLEEHGFHLSAEHTLLGHHLAIRLPRKQFVPARA